MKACVLRIVDITEAVRLWAAGKNVAARLNQSLHSKDPAIGTHRWSYIAKPGAMPNSMELYAVVFNSLNYEFCIYESSPEN